MKITALGNTLFSWADLPDIRYAPHKHRSVAVRLRSRNISQKS